MGSAAGRVSIPAVPARTSAAAEPATSQGVPSFQQTFDFDTVPSVRLVTDLNDPDMNGGGHSQIRSRERVRDLAEVYTHKREVDAMLDLVADMFPSEDDPQNTDRTFLEPACGSGNFLEEILRRKLENVTARRYGRGERYEHRVLRCLASIYGIDINHENVIEARDRLRALLNSHLDLDLNTQAVSPAFISAAEVVLSTNIIHADTLGDPAAIVLIEYRPGRAGTFTREWSSLEAATAPLDRSTGAWPRRDEAPIHYGRLADHPEPVTLAESDAPDPSDLR